MIIKDRNNVVLNKKQTNFNRNIFTSPDTAIVTLSPIKHVQNNEDVTQEQITPNTTLTIKKSSRTNNWETLTFMQNKENWVEKNTIQESFPKPSGKNCISKQKKKPNMNF